MKEVKGIVALSLLDFFAHLENDHLESALGQFVGSKKPCRASTDNGNFVHSSFLVRSPVRSRHVVTPPGFSGTA